MYHPSMVQAAFSAMNDQLQDVYRKIEQTVSAAQLHRLTPLLLYHDVLLAITKYIDETAAKHNYISFNNHISDLFQIEASFVFEPKNKTFNIILHVPFVKPGYMLTLHQYLPFPLSQDFANNHSLIPSVGEKDILAFGFMNTF